MNKNRISQPQSHLAAVDGALLGLLSAAALALFMASLYALGPTLGWTWLAERFVRTGNTQIWMGFYVLFSLTGALLAFPLSRLRWFRSGLVSPTARLVLTVGIPALVGVLNFAPPMPEAAVHEALEEVREQAAKGTAPVEQATQQIENHCARDPQPKECATGEKLLPILAAVSGTLDGQITSSVEAIIEDAASEETTAARKTLGATSSRIQTGLTGRSGTVPKPDTEPRSELPTPTAPSPFYPPDTTTMPVDDMPPPPGAPDAGSEASGSTTELVITTLVMGGCTVAGGDPATCLRVAALLGPFMSQKYKDLQNGELQFTGDDIKTLAAGALYITADSSETSTEAEYYRRAADLLKTENDHQRREMLRKLVLPSAEEWARANGLDTKQLKQLEGMIGRVEDMPKQFAACSETATNIYKDHLASVESELKVAQRASERICSADPTSRECEQAAAKAAGLPADIARQTFCTVNGRSVCDDPEEFTGYLATLKDCRGLAANLKQLKALEDQVAVQRCLPTLTGGVDDGIACGVL